MPRLTFTAYLFVLSLIGLLALTVDAIRSLL